MTQDEAIEILWTAKSAFLTNPDGSMKLDDNHRPIANPKGSSCWVETYPKLLNLAKSESVFDMGIGFC